MASAKSSWLLAVAGGTQTFDSKALLTDALAREASSDPRDFRFQETRHDEGQQWISLYDPNGDPQWTLTAVDGLSPDQEQLKTAEQWRSPPDKKDKESSKSSLLGKMIDPDQAELVEVNEQQAIYRFTPVGESEDDQKLFRHLHGRLYIDLGDKFIVRVVMNNEESFKLMTGVRFDRFEMEMEFAMHDDLIIGQSLVLPKLLRTDVKGRAFLVKSIDEQSQIVFDQYQAPDAALSMISAD